MSGRHTRRETSERRGTRRSKAESRVRSISEELTEQKPMKILMIHGVATVENAKTYESWNTAITDGLKNANYNAPVNATGVDYNDIFAKYDSDPSVYFSAALELIASAAWHSLLSPEALEVGAGPQPGEDFWEQIRWSAGMVAQWVVEAKLRSDCRDRLLSEIQKVQPDVIFAHSLGTLLCYDLFANDARGKKAFLSGTLVTFGSQIGNPFVKDRMWNGQVLPMIPFARWINIYNPHDPVFVAPLDVASTSFYEFTPVFGNALFDGSAHEATADTSGHPGYLDNPVTEKSVYPLLAGGNMATLIERNNRMTKLMPKDLGSAVVTAAGQTATTLNLFSTQIKDLKTAKREWSERLLNTRRTEGFRALGIAASLEPDQNVVGVGVGEQVVDDKPTGVIALKFFVRVKYPKHELSRKALLPTSVGGYAVDVEEVGLFRRFAVLPNPKTKIRPAQPGCSIGFRDPNDQFKMAGTFGALVTNDQGTYVLSNNHVLADEGQLAPGAEIYQPGLLDGGNPSTDQIASLTSFIPLQSTGNQVDCAIAKVISTSLVSPNVLLIGKPAGTAEAAIDMSVHKFGRTTAYTVGRVTSIDTDVTVSYETGTFTFQEQIIIVGQNGAPFSAAGDSGSLILERGTNNAVGLLFAGSDSHTIANHIDDVLTALKVTLV